MRQNMIFTTIKVVKSWDSDQFQSMGDSKRLAIKRALLEDAEKLMEEGDQSDSELEKLKSEIKDVDRIFSVYDQNDQADQLCASLESKLGEYERQMQKMCKASVPRNVASIKVLADCQKEFEARVQKFEPRLDDLKTSESPKVQEKLKVMSSKLEGLWTICSDYVNRLKTLETTLMELEEVSSVLSDFEMTLASHNHLQPDKLDQLKQVQEDLLTLETEVETKQVN